MTKLSRRILSALAMLVLFAARAHSTDADAAWLFTQDGTAVYGTTQGAENAGRYGLGLRADYALAPRVSLYALSTWQRNVYAGIEHQFDEGAGAVYHAILPKPQRLDFKLGLGTFQRRSTVPTDQSFSTARLGARSAQGCLLTQPELQRAVPQPAAARPRTPRLDGFRGTPVHVLR